MNSMNENKREDRKIIQRFILITILGGIVGFILGFAGSYINMDGLYSVGKSVGTVMVFLVPAVMIILNVIFLFIGFWLIRKARKKLGVWDEEDEAFAKSIERKVDFSLFYISILMILDFMLFSIGMGLVKRDESLLKSQSIGISVIIIFCFIIGIAGVITCQKLGVDLIKKMNPEMRGNILDTRFLDKWEASCDEAQKMMIYKSAYKSYKSVNLICILLWTISALGDMILQTGMLPVALISIIWLVQNLSYSLEAMRLEK